VFATTDEYDPYYTGQNRTGSLMSVMLDNGSYWAQLGWIKDKQSGSIKREIFVEHVDGFGNNLWFFWAQKPVGSITGYKITFDSSNHHFHYYVDGSEYANLGASFSWSPTRWEIFGETHDRADQMPGGYNGHAHFSNSQFRQSGSWQVANATPHSDGTINKATHPWAGAYDIWDTACAS
jgi:hypothetical protein